MLNLLDIYKEFLLIGSFFVELNFSTLITLQTKVLPFYFILVNLIFWFGKYFYNFRRNAQSLAVSSPQAGLKLRAQTWLFSRIISQCQVLRGLSIKSGCFIYLVSMKDKSNRNKHSS